VGGCVFVDGVPGSGKSTSGQFLARQLARYGRPARWIYEEEIPKPFVPDVPDDSYRDWAHYTDLRVEAWRAFARDIAAGAEVVVIESGLLQLPVFSMLRRDADPASIVELVLRVADAIAPLAPRLVYLRHPDPAVAWHKAADRSDERWVADRVRASATWPYLQSRALSGLDGVLAYWRAHGALCDAIVARLVMDTLVLDMTAEPWPERRARMCAFLGVPADEPPPADVRELQRLTGRYRDGPREVTIALEDGRLVMRGTLWRVNALLPVTSTVFDVEAWPFRFTFELGAESVARGFRWSGPALWWGDLSGVFARV
jgi:hypothetical protein